MIQIVIITNFVVVSNAGIQRVDCSIDIEPVSSSGHGTQAVIQTYKSVND